MHSARATSVISGGRELPSPGVDCRHAAIGPGQRELSLKRLFGHKHYAQRGAFPGRPRRGQERDLARHVTGGRRALPPRVPRRESQKECAGNQRQRCRCSPDELECRKHWPCPYRARRHSWLKIMAKLDRPSDLRPPRMRVPPRSWSGRGSLIQDGDKINNNIASAWPWAERIRACGSTGSDIECGPI
jgi:hypothetical protein